MGSVSDPPGDTNSRNTWRGDKTSTQRGYGYKWQKARAEWLRLHPLCVYCMRQGRVVEATVVDHIVPHRGDLKLFWNRKNWQSLCKTCHDSIKAAEERSGRFGGCGLDGLPLDARHHWNRTEG